MQYTMSTEQQPLLGEVNASPQIYPIDKLPSYTESTGHIVLSVNIPPPPPYTYAGQVTTRTESNRDYPAIQVFAFGLCMLVGGAILYGFKHGL